MGKSLPQFEAQYKHRPLRLQERDLQILKKVWEYEFLNSKHLRAMFSDQVGEPVVRGEKTDEAITRRLQKLFHHGYLNRPKNQIQLRIRYGNLPFIYTLGKKGAQELAKEYGIDPGRTSWRAKSRVKHPHIMHKLMISKFHASLEVALKGRPKIELIGWKKEGELQSAAVKVRSAFGGRTKVKLLPDGFFGLRFRDRPEGTNKAYFFLEADRSTMPNTRFYRKKVLGYIEYYRRSKHREAYKISEFRVLTTTLTKERRDNLRETIQNRLAERILSARNRKRFVFACEKDYGVAKPASILSKIWFRLVDQEPCSILPPRLS